MKTITDEYRLEAKLDIQRFKTDSAFKARIKIWAKKLRRHFEKQDLECRLIFDKDAGFVAFCFEDKRALKCAEGLWEAYNMQEEKDA